MSSCAAKPPIGCRARLTAEVGGVMREVSEGGVMAGIL